ncbi:GNAT family N-acetyltransferase [Actinomadura alba]|uniref:GNAT family N-acetyltransferase n=1 Tax=Actinomadura alba TaxID=406431 RepID=A0ABR7LPA9_9ACTN|nr:GNAT family N-acetyltransferase [Actinomadura alba]MBC6466575.1 GNAT family N-acetyltransferase [Actinomadura alba]
MSEITPVTFRHYDAAGARSIREVVMAIQKDAYADAIASGDPFDSTDAFMTRFEAYTQPTNPGFELVVAYTSEDEPIGQTWGWPLGPEARWWTGLQMEPEPEFTREDGTRTFALSEIMVCKARTGHGIAHALHDELLKGRREKRATLLAEPGNVTAYRAYTAWGWKHVAQLRPGWPNAPLFDVLIFPLPLAAR